MSDDTARSEEGKNGKSRRGFASMNAARQREIARKGGKAAHEKGTAHEFTSDEARDAGRKGGQAISRNRSHMAEIGREGGRRSPRENQSDADVALSTPPDSMCQKNGASAEREE